MSASARRARGARQHERAQMNKNRLNFFTCQRSLREASGHLVTEVRSTLQKAQEVATAVETAEKIAEEAARYCDGVIDLPKDLTAHKQSAELAAEIQNTIMWVQHVLEMANLADGPENVETGTNLLNGSGEAVSFATNKAIDHSHQKFLEKKEDEEHERQVSVLDAVFRQRALGDLIQQRAEEAAALEEHRRREEAERRADEGSESMKEFDLNGDISQADGPGTRDSDFSIPRESQSSSNANDTQKGELSLRKMFWASITNVKFRLRCRSSHFVWKFASTR